MGSHPTLDDHELAAEARQLDPDDWQHDHAVAHLAADHPQVRTWPDDNPDLAHHLDHRDWIYDHSHPSRERAAEQAFDRLNTAFGVPPTAPTPIGHRDIQQRERALALGVRVSVHDSRQNDRDPIIWQPGQDYRVADALQAARNQPSGLRASHAAAGHCRLGGPHRARGLMCSETALPGLTLRKQVIITAGTQCIKQVGQGSFAEGHRADSLV